MGLKPGDAIAIDMLMTAESVAIYLGIVKVHDYGQSPTVISLKACPKKYNTLAHTVTYRSLSQWPCMVQHLDAVVLLHVFSQINRGTSPRAFVSVRLRRNFFPLFTSERPLPTEVARVCSPCEEEVRRCSLDTNTLSIYMRRACHLTGTFSGK